MFPALRMPSQIAPYALIKRHVVGKIQSGEWEVAGRVPSENQLAAEFGVSRTTARRALLDLVQEGWIVRSQGLGTFVTDRKPMLSMLEVRNIADEIAERGHSYANRVVTLETIAASEAIGMYLGVRPGSKVFHSIIVHIDDGMPVQVEDRHVNPSVIPDYIRQNFSKVTPNAYLGSVAPIEALEHVVEAVLPTAQTLEWLELTPPEACLQINRRTWAAGQVASYARLVHPGSRYRLGGYVPLPRGATPIGARR